MARFSTLVTLTMLAIFTAMVAMAMTFPVNARFMPLVVGIPGIVLCLVQLCDDWPRARRRRAAPALATEVSDGEPEAEGAPGPGAELRSILYFLGYIAGVLAFGFLPAIPVLVTLYLWREAGVRLWKAAAAGIFTVVVVWLMFVMLLEFRLFPGHVTPLLMRLGG